MIRRPPRSTRTDTLFPYTTLFRSLLDGLKERAEHLVASLSPQPLPLTTLTQVLRGLLAENISLKEFRRIAAAISVAAQKTVDADEIIELIRPELGALIKIGRARVGKESVSTCRYRWSAYHSKKEKNNVRHRQVKKKRK